MRAVKVCDDIPSAGQGRRQMLRRSGVSWAGGQNSPAEWSWHGSRRQTLRMALPVIREVLGSVLGFERRDGFEKSL